MFETNLGQREELSNDGVALLEKLLHSKIIRNSLVGNQNAFFTEELNNVDQATRQEYLKEYDKRIGQRN